MSQETLEKLSRKLLMELEEKCFQYQIENAMIFGHEIAFHSILLALSTLFKAQTVHFSTILGKDLSEVYFNMPKRNTETASEEGE